MPNLDVGALLVLLLYAILEGQYQVPEVTTFHFIYC